ncbi:MAG: bifunctional demethylmenaquinone methyltransferase/2-methoxy-6-polyprenyl-1,4-benzoquinol methylase UbiE [Bacteroidota bacterium]
MKATDTNATDNAHRPPVGEMDGKKEQVEAMFDAIAPRYDLLNRVLSFGIDTIWRKQAIRLLRGDRPRRLLDVATGTADLALEAYKQLQPEQIIGVDIAEEMLSFGREKIAKLGLGEIITLQRGDAAHLPFDDHAFDAAIVSFGVRNFEDLHAGLRDIRRVLKPGGALVVLEFSRPRAFPVKQAYRLYSKEIMPRVGRTLSKESAGAYDYLPESAAVFPDGEDFLERMRTAGYHGVMAKPLTFGVATLYKGYVPAA